MQIETSFLIKKTLFDAQMSFLSDVSKLEIGNSKREKVTKQS